MIKKIKISSVTEVMFTPYARVKTRLENHRLIFQSVSTLSIHSRAKSTSSFNRLTVEFLKTTLHPYTISRSFFEESPSRGGHHRGIFPCTEEERKKGLFIRWAALIAAIVRRTLDQAGEPFEQHEKTCLDHRSGASMQTRRGLWTGGRVVWERQTWSFSGKQNTELWIFTGTYIFSMQFVRQISSGSRFYRELFYIYIFIYFCIGYDFLVIIILKIKIDRNVFENDLESRHVILLYSLSISFQLSIDEIIMYCLIWQDFTDCTKVEKAARDN